MRYSVRVVYAVLALLLLAACAPLQRAVEQRRPSAELEGVRITDFDFENLTLAFDVAVDNPNPLGVTLSGFDYTLHLDGREFLRGEQSERVAIAGGGASTVAIPLTLPFAEIYRAFSDLRDVDEIPYTLAVDAFFDVPVLGRIRVPAQEEGSVPLVKPPRLGVRALRVNNLSLAGVDLALELAVDNPNGFFLQLDDFDYRLALNGQPWLRGRSDSGTRIEAHEEGVIRVPLSADFQQLGSGLSAALTGSGRLDYSLDGSVALRTGNARMERVVLPLSLEGRLPVTR